MEYIDFHTHTNLSDGLWTEEEVVSEAERCGIGVMAITDHNYTADLTQLRKKHPNIQLVQGAEISAMYTDPEGSTWEVHVVGLGFDPEHPAIVDVLSRNQVDHRPYVNAILKKLETFGMYLGTYDTLREEFPITKHIGRGVIAQKAVQLGYAKSSREFFEEYIGNFGKRKAYVKSPLQFIDLETCVNAILAAGGVAVLAHLFYYRRDEQSNRALVKRFKDLAGERGAMETSYSMYTETQREYLRTLADEFGLAHSAGSDFHAKEGDVLNHHFHRSQHLPLLQMLGCAELSR